MNGLLAALGFLTTLPLPSSAYRVPAPSGLAWFPFVGLVLGSLLVLANHALTWCRVDPLVTGILLTTLLAWLTGGLHLDGLADTADGFAGSRDQARRLEIMKDSRIGAIGSLTLTLLLMLKAAALARPGNRDAALLLGPVCGRLHQLLTLFLLPGSRPGGLGEQFRPHVTPQVLLLALGTSVTSGLVLLTPEVAALTLLVTIALTLSFHALCRLKIGGMTGDTLGAGCELTETGIWLLLTHIH